MPRPSILDLYSPYTGLISYVSEAEAGLLDPEVSVVASATADTRQYGLDQVAGNGSGAGLFFDQALHAALGEGLERYALLLRFPEQLRIGSYDELRRDGLCPVSPTELPLFDERQYDNVPFARFGEKTVLAWVSGNELKTRRQREVPACLVYVPYQPIGQDKGEQVIGVGFSTGAACASSIDEALVKGICEIVERDAFIIVWRNRLSCPEIRIDKDSAIYNIYRRKFARKGLEFHLYLTALDIDIPSVVGVVYNHRCDPVGTVVAGAASPMVEDAVLKTLRELVQGLRWAAYLDAGRARPVDKFEDVRSFRDRMHLFAFSDMRGHFDFLRDGNNMIDLSTFSQPMAFEHASELEHCVEALVSRGLNPIGLNLTPLDAQSLGLVVCKVIVPGMEIMEADHRMPFLGSNRWRDVPVKTGRRQMPLEVRAQPDPSSVPVVAL